MLVLTRKEGESFKIGDNIQITVTNVRGRQARIGIIAPKNITIARLELLKKGANNE